MEEEKDEVKNEEKDDRKNRIDEAKEAEKGY